MFRCSISMILYSGRIGTVTPQLETNNNSGFYSYCFVPGLPRGPVGLTILGSCYFRINVIPKMICVYVKQNQIEVQCCAPTVLQVQFGAQSSTVVCSSTLRPTYVTPPVIYNHTHPYTHTHTHSCTHILLYMYTRMHAYIYMAI